VISLFRRAPTGPPCAHCGEPVTGSLVREWTGPAGTPARTWHGDRPDCRAAALPDADDVPDYIAGARALLANDVQGRCPACGCTRLLLGEGGYVTCPRIDCPEPDAASTLLEGPDAQPDETARCPKLEPHASHMWTWREEGVDCPGLPSANATTRHVGTSAVAAPATADDGLRERYAAAISAKIDGTEGCANGHRLADAVMAVRDRRMEQLAARAEGVERSVQLLTTDLLNVAQQREQAEATVTRVRAIQPYTARTHGDRSEGYRNGWNAARDAIATALDGPGADHA
jgi:ribosomal protein L34E